MSTSASCMVLMNAGPGRLWPVALSRVPCVDEWVSCTHEGKYEEWKVASVLHLVGEKHAAMIWLVPLERPVSR